MIQMRYTLRNGSLLRAGGADEKTEGEAESGHRGTTHEVYFSWNAAWVGPGMWRGGDGYNLRGSGYELRRFV
ncbi:MAG: hypothetical protein NVSMB62_05990 [Acidobacteriaceae bacterium]